MAATFQTNPVSLHELLKLCHDGRMQLPDFQRSWVWDEDRIKSLVASISRSFPVGALMTLNTGGPVNFQPRPIEGAPGGIEAFMAQALLLDGQQRTTSMYQVTLRGQVVKTMTAKRKPVQRWFYLDIAKCLDPSVDREEAILSVPEDKKIKSDFDRTVDLDLSSQNREFDALMFPLNQVFSWNDWQMEFIKHVNANGTFSEKWPILQNFYAGIIKNFESYQVPVIALDKGTSKEAVCTVFEKVNTGGKPLDAFELVTAMYAADGHELRKDWYGKGAEKGRQHRLLETLRPGNQTRGIVSNVSNTDFLQAVVLFHARDRRREAEEAGKFGKDLPSVAPHRSALLDLPLSAYLKYQTLVEEGFVKAARFLHTQHIYRVFDLPYQSQIVPLAAILADMGDAWEHQANRKKLMQWYWCGVFGELYGSAVESRMARDFLEVVPWLNGGPEPSTVRDAVFRSDRLKTMRMRLSAAYKGINALLMKEGAIDWLSGQAFSHAVFFNENVDIHHIFPKDWCAKQGIKPDRFDSIINKTPLAYRTNRIIGGAAPSAYLAKLDAGASHTPPIASGDLDEALKSHLITPKLLRADDFEGFMTDRQHQLLVLVEAAMGKPSNQNTAGLPDDPESAADHDDDDVDAIEAGLTLEAAE
ncbi:DUF262 domain-containing protein [Aureimonas sp. AU4]|uniref:GmrSD restriction endonuclease domain-containing protein n=1 Tax=Aureimonas sp. AU4 TaxID=1638163 RepID=UPI000781D044|nr:DUF262 domain-containing protein [Aureimonas sp. AU4]